MLKNKPVVVFVGTYPPRECGVATFTQDLLHSSRQFLGSYITCKVAALNLSPLDSYVYPPEVGWQISQDNKKEYLDLAQTINANPLVSGIVLQHEYGIYGGEQGENILTFIEQVKKPILVTLHTVLPNPSSKMKEVTSEIIKHANIIVVLTHNSRKILEVVYPFAIGKVYVIPHGIHPTEFSSTTAAKKKLKLKDHTILSTFGLLSRGKGIEFVIKALPKVIEKYPKVQYLILGETHPAIRRSEGEAYRNELAKLVAQLDLKMHVKFYDQYLDLDDLLNFLKATDIYISSSINPDQAVSGTLSYALGTGRAVMSTQFAQAKEIVTPDIGRLVPILDSSAITHALTDLLSDEEKLHQMHQRAYDVTRTMLWSNVAKEYSDLLTQVVLPPINLGHLKKMTDEFGMFQFAQGKEPDKQFGYTLDDNARALIVSNQLHLPKYIALYLNFIEACQQPDGTFINYLSHGKRKQTPQNESEDLSDAHARAMWALSVVIVNKQLPRNIRSKAEKMFMMSIPHIQLHPHLRAKAFTIKALAITLDAFPTEKENLVSLISKMAESLAVSLKENTNDSWHWFEEHLGYNNAVLSESLLIAGAVLNSEELSRLGTSSLQFLISETFSTNMYAPIGHSNWYKRNEKRSYFDQQPEDPCSMILALTTAFKLTGYESYKNLAIKCFSWFIGNNSLHQSVYDFQTGGCYDGLHPDRVNLNQGAESLISYLLSRLAITQLDTHEDSTISKHFS